LESRATGIEAWANGNGGPFELLADSARWEIVGTPSCGRSTTVKKDFIDSVIAPLNARMSSALIPSARGLYADGDTVVELFKASATVKDAKPYNKSQLFEPEFTG